MLAAAKDDVLIVQSGGPSVRNASPPYDEEPHSPNVEIFGVTGAPAATKETESHDGRREPGDELGDETVRSEKKEGSESI